MLLGEYFLDEITIQISRLRVKQITLPNVVFLIQSVEVGGAMGMA